MIDLPSHGVLHTPSVQLQDNMKNYKQYMKSTCYKSFHSIQTSNSGYFTLTILHHIIYDVIHINTNIIQQLTNLTGQWVRYYRSNEIIDCSTVIISMKLRQHDHVM